MFIFVLWLENNVIIVKLKLLFPLIMDSQEISPRNRSKKHKRQRSSRPPASEDSSNDLVIVDDLKPLKATPTSSSSSLKKRRKRDSASSDEERWLTAIESGKLEDVDDELKKIKPKDPALMTARQRAMYDRGSEGGVASVNTPTLMSLPTGYKEKVMTAEAIKKAAIKSLKRKQMADEKREKDKKKTMERLLKKQDSKAVKGVKKIAKTNVPVIIYRQNLETSCILLPDGCEFPLKKQLARVPPAPVLCAMGCGNYKKYSCSKTRRPLCSLGCYRKNIVKI